MGRPRQDISPSLAARVAVLYYEDNKTHDDIGHLLGLSRWKVSRLLQHAKDSGIVRIHIQIPTGRLNDLENQLAQHTGINQVIVVETEPDSAMAAVARAAADYLDEMGPGLESLAMSWGRTLTAVADALPDKWAAGIDVVHVNGGMSVLDTSESASWAVATVADKAAGRAHVMPAPAIVHLPETATALRADRTVSQVMERARGADAAVFTVGVATPDSAHVTSGYLSPEEVGQLRDAGAVGDVVGRFIDAAGQIVDPDLDQRTLGVDLDHLAQIPQRILVAASADKAAAVWACVRRGLVTTLIVDADLAHSVLTLASEEKAHV